MSRRLSLRQTRGQARAAAVPRDGPPSARGAGAADGAGGFLYDEAFLAWIEELKRDLDVLVPGEATRRIFARVWAVWKLLPRTRVFLLEGETGTGKEKVARAIAHLFRRGGPLVSTNLGSIPPTLFESEMFGHTRGAFTGADRDKVGLLDAAGGGCFFGDEIDSLGLDLQTKLLRLLGDPEREVSYFPVGSEHERRSDCIFIFASGEPLEELVARGDFRSDLFYRLQTTRFRLPPLRERGDEVVAFFRAHLAAHAGQPIDNVFVDSAASRRLVDHTWPGNLRELFGKASQALLAMGFRSGQDAIFVRPEHLGLLGHRDPPGNGAAAPVSPAPRSALAEAIRAAAPADPLRHGDPALFGAVEDRLVREDGLTTGELAAIAAGHGTELSPRQARSWLRRIERRLAGSGFLLVSTGRTRGTRYALRPARAIETVEPASAEAPSRLQGVWELVLDWHPRWSRRLLFHDSDAACPVEIKDVQTRGRVYFMELQRREAVFEVVGILHVQATIAGRRVIFSDLVSDFRDVECDSDGNLRRMSARIRFKKERQLEGLDGIPFRYSPVMRYEATFTESSPERMRGFLIYRDEAGTAHECGRVLFELYDRF